MPRSRPARFALVIAVFLSSSSVLTAVEVTGLRCDHRESPLGINVRQPALSWQLRGNRQGAAQRAYHIQAASSLREWTRAVRWDTGWIEDDRSVGILYKGTDLGSGERIFWRVRIKDELGEISAWSQPSWFEAGLWTESDWQGAEWISCTRTRTPQMAPAEVMGPWIAPEDLPEEPSNEPLTYRLKFDLENKLVVYAGTWWGAPGDNKVDCYVNNQIPRFAPNKKGRNYTDFGFQLVPGENQIELRLDATSEPLPISFGMQIVFADGEERIVRSSTQWLAEAGPERNLPTRQIGAYGSEPLGEAIVHSLEPIPATWYKRDFTADKPIASARLYLCGLGYGLPFINGQRLNDHVLDPGQTDYEEFAHYIIYDVTASLKKDTNTVSVLLGDGWYNQDHGFNTDLLRYGKPGLRARLHLRYTDGTESNIVTDEAWRWKASEIQVSNIYIGEKIDFRAYHDEWTRPGFGADWQSAKVVPPLSPKLIAQDFPPMRKIRTIKPVKTWSAGKETWIVDLGQNIAGWIALDLDEPAGKTVRIRCGELLKPDGKHLENSPVSFWWCHHTPQAHEIISDGTPRSWEPRFNYHGFRYAEISGLSEAPRPGQIRGVVVHTDTPVTASFTSSDPLLDRIFKMGIQTHLNNMHSILEDCPHRERCMWGGDLHASWATGYYTLDANTFYRQAVRLYYTPPFADGGIPGSVGVGKRLTRHVTDFTWSVSPLFLAWRQYQEFGDLAPAREHYAVMQHFLRHFEKHAPDLIPEQAMHGDHARSPDVQRIDQNKRLVAAQHFFAAARRFAELADALDQTEDAAWSRALAERIRASIEEKFYAPEQNTFGNGMHDSLALAFGIVTGEEAKAVAESLSEVYLNNGSIFDGGFMSYNIYPKLSEYGHVDLALQILRNPNYPGIAWSIEQHDATTIWEQFHLDPAKRKQRSHNHHAMNYATGWMLTHLAGIQTHPDEPGAQRLLLKPHLPEALGWVKASVRTAYGEVTSRWEKKGSALIWEFTIPPNTSAEVVLPEGASDIVIHGEHQVRHRRQNPLEMSAGRHRISWKSQAQKPPLSRPSAFRQ